MEKFDCFENDVFHKFFKKSKTKTSHETLCVLNDGTLIPGYTGIGSFYYTHINFFSMKQALKELVFLNDKHNYVFVETGCSAHGTKSTLLWDKFVNFYNGEVYSVDLNKKAVDVTRKQVSDKTRVVCDDSLNFLKTFEKQIDFLYLDSYDLDWLDPELSAQHHLQEFLTIKHLLHENSIILIDDTPINNDWLDDGKNNKFYDTFSNKKIIGKGSYINDFLEKTCSVKILHQYQSLWKFNSNLK